jgi:hypothetical protein
MGAMLLVALAWMYVVTMMAVAEATSNQGTWLGAVFTLLLYGALPLSIVMYVMNTPARRARRKALEAEEARAAAAPSPSGAGDPDRGGHAPGDAVAPEREEP